MEGDRLREESEETQERESYMGTEIEVGKEKEILPMHCGLMGNQEVPEEHGLPH